MKTKIIVLIAVAVIGVGGVTVVVLRKDARKQKQVPSMQSELPEAMSNYNKTFKLNTSPPIFPESKAALTNRSSDQKTSAVKP